MRALDVDEPGGAVHEHPGLAAARARDHERRRVGGRDGLALGLVQGLEYRGDVHIGDRVQSGACKGRDFSSF